MLIGDDFPVTSTENILNERLQALRSIFDEDISRHHGKIWGNKITTEQSYGLEECNTINVSCVDVLSQFVSTMHGYRIIYIARHGASCIDSKVRRTGQPLLRAALRWCYGVRVFERLMQLGAITYWCKYEDLVSEPRSILNEMCAALDIDFNENMLGQTQNPLLIPEYRYERFLSEKAYAIPELPQELASFIRPWLHRMGY